MKKILTTVFYNLAAISVFAQTYGGGKGTESNPYLISSKADMEQLSIYVNGGSSYKGTYFLLTCDLTGINDVVGRDNLTSFMGVFDGNGYEINVNIKGNENYPYAGVFGHCSNATIKNLKVSGKITWEVALYYYNTFYAAGICGYATQTNICNCTNNANISFSSSVDRKSCYFYGGGICGYTETTTIANSFNTGTILSFSSSYSNYNCYYKFYSGGICGYMSSTTALSSMINYCYNSGNVSSSFSPLTDLLSYTHYFAYSGGICGFMENRVNEGNVVINNCYNNGKIFASSEIPVVTGKSTIAYSGGICGGGVSELSQNGHSPNTTISNCYNIGNISSSAFSPSSFSPYSGGICGFSCYIDNCFVANCQITTNYNSNIGRLSGNGANGSVKNCYADNLVVLNNKTINNASQNDKNGKDVNVAYLQNQSWLQSTLLWDFSATWCILGTGKFPELQMQYNTSADIAEINASEVSIYPNPVKYYLFIQSDRPIKKVEIYDLSGIRILTNKNVTEKLDVSGLINGFYLARIYIDEILLTKKIVIKK